MDNDDQIRTPLTFKDFGVDMRGHRNSYEHLLACIEAAKAHRAYIVLPDGSVLKVFD